MSETLTDALTAWRALLGAERVLSSSEAELRYGHGTEGFSRRIAGALKARSAAEIPTIVQIAARFQQPLYTISTGKNWGYGSAAPVLDDCVLLDLGELKQILDFDAVRGLVTLEPGVTQGELRAFLDQGGHKFMVPVTGAGPGCSLLANALERGYGITPHTDHFAALTRLEAVLADGSLYRSALSEWGGEAVDKGFKWGVGPYLDGLFTQGNFGIVTQATLALAPEPQSMNVMFFSFTEETALPQAVALVQTLFRRFRGIIGGINLLNRQRMLSMLEAYPRGEVQTGQTIPEARIVEMAARHQVFPWTGVTALYGDPAVVAAARKAIKRLLKPHCVRVLCLSTGQIGALQQLARLIPGGLGDKLRGQLRTLQASTDIMLGRPGEVALPLAYWRTAPPPSGDLHPARDRCGLLWFAPLLPLSPEVAADFTQLAARIMREHGIEPLITLTCFSEQSADSTLPILYDPLDPQALADAHACYQALYAACQAHGYLPYRLNIEHQRRLAEDGRSWSVVARLKQALDPHNLLSPGRYAPAHLPDKKAPASS